MMGNRQRKARSLLPWRYVLFLTILALCLPLLAFTMPWYQALIVAFDLAALGFGLTLPPLLRHDPGKIRDSAARNDANRAVMLLITVICSLAVMAAVGIELHGRASERTGSILLALITLSLAWLFANIVYALHYAHLYYRQDEQGDCAGIRFPQCGEPEYWDFIYFAFTLGMTFQTSDTEITTLPIRRTAILHSLAAFVFNLGILGFTINLLGGQS